MDKRNLIHMTETQPEFNDISEHIEFQTEQETNTEADHSLEAPSVPHQRVLEDLLHVFRRVTKLLKWDHSWYHEFLICFRNTVFKLDTRYQKAVDDVLSKYYGTDVEALMQSQTGSDWCLKRIPRRVPPAHTLAPESRKAVQRVWKQI